MNIACHHRSMLPSVALCEALPLFSLQPPIPLPLLSFLADLASYFKEKMRLIEENFLMLTHGSQPSVHLLLCFYTLPSLLLPW